MAVSAFAVGARLWNDKGCLEQAKRTGEYLWHAHRDETGKVFRTQGEGNRPRAGGFLEDYAHLAEAYLELFKASGEDVWRTRAAEVAKQMVHRFSDEAGGAFYYSDAGEESNLPRIKNADDSPTPSGNSIAARVLMELEDRDRARGILEDFSDDLSREPRGMSSMMESLTRYVRRYGPLDIAGRDNVMESKPRRVNFAASWADSRTLRIGVSIAEGWHINANPCSAGLKPTVIRVIGKSEELAKDYIYPEASRLGTPLGEIDVYEGDVAVIIKFKESMIGREDVRIMIVYQPCNGERCEEEEREIYEVDLR
jgi:uncharacterized protein YyaL (SSP411 family)